MRKILVVEDDLRFQRNYRRGCHHELQQKLFDFEFAASGEKGLEVLQNDINQEIALVILDLKMELAQIDGLKFLQETSDTPLIRPIICHTAYPDKIKKLDQKYLSNVVCVLPKGNNQPQLKIIKDIILFWLRFDLDKILTHPHRELLNYEQVLDLIKSFSNQRKISLIKDLISDMSYSDLKEFYKDILPCVKSNLDSIQEKNQKILRKWVIEQIKAKVLPSSIPTDNLIVYRIEESIRGSKEKTKYYYLKWFDKKEGKDKSKYLPLNIAASLPPEFRSP
ncbi:response regulator receiver protein [Gloeothece citriformis PCC 7424]|uniref:Response regulator receiver protein n=1 Tax=Gloeothece citriformis (strain PCC 7424) TaxID=65393 RepID=B7KFN4_GLOC7|nr:response regulator [Gloeothece citriformis]ACK73359.1 response regulator receiver protein [Gloeothece citriformis PCC 7424]